MKRCFDAVAASVLLLALAPFLALVALAQAIALGPPILFRQQRAGLGGRPFTILKFRTMRADEGGDADRLTRWGRFLRATSLDELPELWNVVRGDMSLVGPRPLPTHYLPRYTSAQAERHNVRPGITGLAQVNGRNQLTWERQFEFDREYVARRTFFLDLEILALTIAKVFRREAISAEGEATRAEFMGSGRDAP